MQSSPPPNVRNWRSSTLSLPSEDFKMFSSCDGQGPAILVRVCARLAGTRMSAAAIDSSCAFIKPPERPQLCTEHRYLPPTALRGSPPDYSLPEAGPLRCP